MSMYDYQSSRSVKTNNSTSLIDKNTFKDLINGDIEMPDKKLINIRDFRADYIHNGKIRRYGGVVAGAAWLVDYDCEKRDVWLALGFPEYDSYEDYVEDECDDVDEENPDIKVIPPSEEVLHETLLVFASSPVIPNAFAVAVARDMIENGLKVTSELHKSRISFSKDKE